MVYTRTLHACMLQTQMLAFLPLFEKTKLAHVHMVHPEEFHVPTSSKEWRQGEGKAFLASQSPPASSPSEVRPLAFLGPEQGMLTIARQSHVGACSGDSDTNSAREAASEEQAEHRSWLDSWRPSSLASELECLRCEGMVGPAKRVRASISSARCRNQPSG